MIPPLIETWFLYTCSFTECRQQHPPQRMGQPSQRPSCRSSKWNSSRWSMRYGKSVKKKRILHLQSKAFPAKLGYCEISYWNPIFSLCILCAFSCSVVTCRPSSIVPGQYPPYAGTMWGGKINLLLLFVNHYLVLSHYHVRYGSETSGSSFRNAMMMMMMMEDE